MISRFADVHTSPSSALTNPTISFQTKNSTNYWNLLNYLFSPKEAANAAGLGYLRVPLGASDFAAKGSILMHPF
jgi:hypothetical protein